MRPGHDDDDFLATESLHGNEDAFRVLVNRHRGRLHSLASGILHDADLASDAVQDTFLRAYRSLGDYRSHGFFGAWLRRILVNHCISVLRQRHSYLPLDELDQELVARDRGPEEEALARSETDRIRRAMGRLPGHHRTALVLRVLEGLSYREISTLLGVPESTIETWIHRGRLRMRTLLQADAPVRTSVAAAGPPQRSERMPEP